MAVARVHVRSWQAAYRSLLPQDYLDKLRPEDRAERYDFTHRDTLKPHTIVAAEGDAIHGFTTTMPCSDEELPNYGELCALYVDPESWGCGIGAALIAAARRHLAQRGFQHACLWLLKGNTRAARFYEIDGWAADGKHKTEMMWGVTVQDFRYRRRLDEDRTLRERA
ncbi:MAG TPA: GNAT family N-acetyltransferase [Terracidiphilus sp.]|jgi:GNAT superfamily N-acetyltransferase